MTAHTGEIIKNIYKYMNDYYPPFILTGKLLEFLSQMDLEELDVHASKALGKEIENVYRLHLLLQSLQEDL
jgi:hypothetical protein